jgi:formate dehydrogenase iron-sulfur subunit
MDRRQFLKTAGAIGLASTALSKVSFASQSENDQPSEQVGVLTDTTLCIGLNCRRCEIACAKEQNLPPIVKPPEDESVFHDVRRMSESQYTVVNRFNRNGDADHPYIYVKKQCMHCEEPACASACFVKALKKTPEGPVIYDADLCVGCRYCMIACPFDVPAYEYDKAFTPRVRKCVMCYATKTSKGQVPACVEACPNEVMIFGKRDELIRMAYDRIKSYPDRYVRHVYGEHEMGGTNWLFLSSEPFDKIGLRTDLGNTPPTKATGNYLSAAPLVMTMWPVFFTGLYLFTRRRDELMQEQQHNGKEEKE